MAHGEPLRTTFLLHASAAHRAELERWPGLNDALGQICAMATAAWPTIAMDHGAFLPHMARHLPPEVPAVQSLALLRIEELYLACACALGNETALGELLALHGSAIRGSLRRFARQLDLDELTQQVHAKLFVSEVAAPARIAHYSGRGSLRGFLLVTAGRVALSLLRKANPEVPADSRDGRTPDPELDLIKQLYRSDFRAAFETAVGRLSVRERNLLRHTYFDGMTVDGLGALYGVSRATAARWVARARKVLLDELRAALADRLGAETAEVESMLLLVQSRLDVSLRTLFDRGT